ncbi:MAG: response regulator [Planctomycetes bacterium]|nr:response regulator [Planctomycetota bacterium]
MNSRPEDVTARTRREAELERELRLAQRSLRAMQRDRERAETFALRSKQAILGTNRELQSTIQDLERTLAALEEAKRRAERASEAKGRFVATISHELRTPMNGILGTAELLAHSELSPQDQELVAVIRRSGRALLSIIGDVLDFTKAESGRIELESLRFDLRSTLQAINDLMINAAKAKGVALELCIAPNVPRFVMGDPVRLRQVLLNLLDNAVKFTSSGSVSLDVCRSEGEESRIWFAVIDTGIGIPAEVQQSVFEPFVQADSTTTRKYGGSGLGLAICKQLVGLMGGEIEIASVPGQGTCFHFEARMPCAEDQSADLTQTGLHRMIQTRLDLHVLVADDNSVNRLIAVRMLEKLGCTAVAVENGREAIEFASRERFDAILMDCSMPEIDGFQATAAIRKLAAPWNGVRIIALTAYATAGDRERCLAEGMDDYITKPMRLRELGDRLAGRALAR